MTAAPDPAAIAARLTKAQREAVLRATAPDGPGMWPCRNALTRDGLFTGFAGTVITPLGLSVRAILKDSSHGQ